MFKQALDCHCAVVVEANQPVGMDKQHKLSIGAFQVNAAYHLCLHLASDQLLGSWKGQLEQACAFVRVHLFLETAGAGKA